GQAVDVGTGAPYPPALHDGSPSPGSRHVPSQVLATPSTAKDQDFKPFLLRHAILRIRHLPRLSRVPMRRPRAGRSPPVTIGTGRGLVARWPVAAWANPQREGMHRSAPPAASATPSTMLG